MKVIFLLATIFVSLLLQAQTKLVVKDKATQEPIAFVTVTEVNGKTSVTDSSGVAFVGNVRFAVTASGYQSVDTVANGQAEMIILLVPNTQSLENITIIASTRSNTSIQNSPLKVEVLGAEELGEEAGIKPGNIASILSDVSGVQIQQLSVASGNSNVRIQGLEGRYTQVLRDGMPLYGGFSGSFGVLTIPPLDLRQIELIKGSASTLFGGGAIGGVVNLISKRPTQEQQLDALINYTTLTEANTNLYVSKRSRSFGYTFFAGYTTQQARDVDGDNFSDVPDLKTVVVHPRLFFYPSERATISLSYEGAFDDRSGGDLDVLRNGKTSLHQYLERNHSIRHTGEYTWEQRLKGNSRLTLKGSVSRFKRNQYETADTVNGRQLNYFTELSLLLPTASGNLVVGTNANGDLFKTTIPTLAALQRYNNRYLGVFGQYTYSRLKNTIIETGLRLDHHHRFGFFALPRLAVVHHFSSHWGGRAGFAMGYKVPDPLGQQIVEYSLTQFNPLSSQLKAEHSYGWNAELNYRTSFSEASNLFINTAFFLTQIKRPIVFRENSNHTIDLYNEQKPMNTSGIDTYVQLNLHEFEIYAGYTFTVAKQTYLTGNQFIPLTPKHRFAFTFVKEWNEAWRVGLEGSFTGKQYRLNGSQTPGYVFLAAMVQRNIGKHVQIVLNGENLLDFRQSKKEPLYTGSVTSPNFQPLWAPIDGRVINMSVRYML